MAKITISRLFEISKYLTTQSGKELQGVLQYLSEFAEVTIRTLRNGITFQDNVDCALRTISITSDTVFTLNPPSGKRVIGVIPLKIESSSYYIIAKFGWFYNSSGQIAAFCSITNTAGSAPSASTLLSLDLLMLFG